VDGSAQESIASGVSLRAVSTLAISRAGAEVLDRLRPLWLELHHHHQAVGGEALGPYVGDDVSWAARRALYAGFLAAGGFALLAERDGELIGYALVAIKTSEETEMDDTWRTDARVAEIETLSVAPAARGAGAGSALLDRIDAELEAEGIHDVLIGAFVTNTDAIRLYERRGFRPAWLQMTRFAGRR
jgi:ribosomal protein S18 acetylase RimI-like enzyme